MTIDLNRFEGTAHNLYTTLKKEWVVSKQIKPRALITGINGMDGSYLAELLLYKGYEVYGIVRRSSVDNLERINHILSRIKLYEGDITDYSFIDRLIREIYPNEIYNLAAQSHVHTSFDIPDYTFRVNTLGLLNILEAVKFTSLDIKVYQASTSEMFGNSPSPQGIDTPFNPQSPYAISKLSAHELIKHYRETYGMYAVSGILFNHESPRRGENFVTRKIIKYFSDAVCNEDLQGNLKLGDINNYRDWGFAPEYVETMYESLQKREPYDFVMGTGETRSVEDFLNLVGEYVDVDWRDYTDWNVIDYIRPADVLILKALPDYPHSTSLEMLIKIMVDYDAGFPEPKYNDYLSGQGFEYFMDNFGEIYSWR